MKEHKTNCNIYTIKPTLSLNGENLPRGKCDCGADKIKEEVVAHCPNCKSEFIKYLSDGQCPECEEDIILGKPFIAQEKKECNKNTITTVSHLNCTPKNHCDACIYLSTPHQDTKVKEKPKWDITNLYHFISSLLGTLQAFDVKNDRAVKICQDTEKFIRQALLSQKQDILEIIEKTKKEENWRKIKDRGIYTDSDKVEIANNNSIYNQALSDLKEEIEKI